MDLWRPLLRHEEKKGVEPQQATGFQSPSDDYLQQPLSYDDLLIPNRAATFIVRAAGKSINDIRPGDYLSVNRAARPRSGGVAIVVIDGQFALRRLVKRQQRWFITTDQMDDGEQVVSESVEFWGMVHAVSRLY